MKLTVLNAGQNYFIRGGSDRYQFQLANLLTEKGHQVIPFAANHPQNQESTWMRYFPQRVNFEHPMPLDLVRFIYSRPAAEAIRCLLRDHKIDIAHLHIYYGQLTASILRPLKKMDVPVVQTLHEYKLVCPTYTLVSKGEICEACQGHAFWHAVQNRCNRGSLARSLLSATETYIARLLGSVRNIDHFIAVSDFQRHKLIEFGIPDEKVSTVHNFISLPRFGANDRPGDYFLYFGRIERIKGVFTLLEAAAEIPDVPLLIVGDGEGRNEVESYLERRQLRHIQLLGFKQGEELQSLVRNSLCTVLPSLWFETFGLAILESFIHGRPVIASRIGGMTEVIDDGIDGFLVPAGDSAALRERLLWMAQHRDESVAMGLRGRRKTETQFGADQHYQKLMDVYQSCL